jgi:hypothetical protein
MGTRLLALAPWLLLLLLQLAGASHVVHRSLEAEQAPSSVPASIVSPLLRTGYHFQPPMNWINGKQRLCSASFSELLDVLQFLFVLVSSTSSLQSLVCFGFFLSSVLAIA